MKGKRLLKESEDVAIGTELKYVDGEFVTYATVIDSRTDDKGRIIYEILDEDESVYEVVGTKLLTLFDIV